MTALEAAEAKIKELQSQVDVLSYRPPSELMKRVSSLEAELKNKDAVRLWNENEALKADLKEQCRINGIGQERELKLIADNAKLLAVIEEMKKEVEVAVLFMHDSGYHIGASHEPETQMFLGLAKVLKSVSSQLSRMG